MSRIHASGALPYTCEERIRLDWQADLWTIPWNKFGLPYCGIYLISPEQKWPIKIGISENAANRLDSLQTAHWSQLRIESYWICVNKDKARAVEAKAHKLFAGRQMMGEWFDVRANKAAEMVEFAAEILGIELVKRIPETEKFAPIRDHIERFYEARAKIILSNS